MKIGLEFMSKYSVLSPNSQEFKRYCVVVEKTLIECKILQPLSVVINCNCLLFRK